MRTAEALRQQGRARVRRRQGRPGRRRPVLRVGGEVPGPGQRGPLPRRQGPRRPEPQRPGRARARRSTTRCRSSASASSGCSAGARCARRRSGPGWAEQAMAVVNEHPDVDVRKLYAGAGRARTSACRSTTSSRSPSSARAARRAGRAARGTSASAENAEFVAVALLLQRWNDIADWLIEDAVRRRGRTAARSSRSPSQGGSVEAALDAADPEARELLERAAVADLDADPRGRGVQPDRRRRPPRAGAGATQLTDPERCASTATRGVRSSAGDPTTRPRTPRRWLLGWLQRRSEERV